VRKLASLFLASAALISTVSLAATPSEGVPLQVRRGFFTETDVGFFWTLGGNDGYSNMQGYLQLGVGYQLTVGDGKGLIPIGVHVGIGANAGNCWATGSAVTGNCTKADNFTNTFIDLTGAYLFQVVERLYIGPKLLVGATLLDPEPVPGKTLGINAGIAASLEYATNMDHFSVGLDISYRIVLGPNIHAFAVYPRVQYTF
jgi:hypothetical protein